MLIAFKLKLALACAAGLGRSAGGGAAGDGTRRSPIRLRDPQAMVELQPGRRFLSRRRRLHPHAASRPTAPLVTVRFERPLAIMKHQVSVADYQRCVDDGACRALDRGVVVAADRPAVQVSWHDANAYAAWLSRKTGERYRLPTDEEWAFAAGSRFKDDGSARRRQRSVETLDRAL